MMRNDKLIPGLILVMIGAIYLLRNFGYIDFHWSNIFHLWPIFLVIGGVNLVFANNSSTWATILKISVVVAGFALLVFGNFGNRYRWWPRYSYHYHNDSDDNDSDDNDENDNSNANKSEIVKVEGNSVFNEPFTAAAHVARLNVDGGATTYTLNDTTNQLFSASTHEFFGKYQLNHHQEDSVYVVDFSMKDHNNGHFSWGDDNDKSNSANIKLNVNPEWEIHVNAGATELNFDLSKFKIREFKVNGGASSFNLKLGQPLAVTNVNISAGMAGAHVDIPKDAACRITTSTAFSSNDFDGFIKEGDGSYETARYNDAKNKININLSGGFSGFEVKRY
jgi:cell wall-active antibiotic response 4TMS protein YvqF